MTELKLPKFEERFESLPRPSKIIMVCSHGQWWLSFYLDGVFTFLQCLLKRWSEKARKQMASILNAEIKQTNVKFAFAIEEDNEFLLYEREGKIMCVVHSQHISSGRDHPFDYQFAFEIANPEAIPAKSFEEGTIRFNDFGKRQHFDN